MLFLTSWHSPSIVRSYLSEGRYKLKTGYLIKCMQVQDPVNYLHKRKMRPLGWNTRAHICRCTCTPHVRLVSAPVGWETIWSREEKGDYLVGLKWEGKMPHPRSANRTSFICASIQLDFVPDCLLSLESFCNFILPELLFEEEKVLENELFTHNNYYCFSIFLSSVPSFSIWCSVYHCF